MEINKSSSFIDSIKIKPDKEKELLLKIQDEIEKRGINKNTIILLTKNLTNEQKNKLKQLYQEQINAIKQSTENYKQQIIRIRKNSL